MISKPSFASLLSESVYGLVLNSVRQPTLARVKTVVRGKVMIVSIWVCLADRGRLIGKSGRHFKNLESLVKSLVKEQGLEATVILDETTPPETGNVADRDSATPPPDIDVVACRLIQLYAVSPEIVHCESTHLGTASIFNIQATPEDADRLQGYQEGCPTFETPVWNYLTAAVDAAGRNHGRTIKLTLSPIDLN